MTFDELGLMPELLRAVADSGYTEPTPIQQQAIPVVLAGKDVMGGAQTGTGKTAGFTLPLLQRLAKHASSSPSPAKHPVRALLLCPTRELAMQVYESVKTYSKYLPLRSTCIYGGVDMRAQIEELRRGVEIVVATPGRLLDHVQQKTVNFGQVEMLVLDEADRMLDMGFIPDIKRVLALLPENRQSLLFSATFSNEIKKLADSMLKAPQLIEVARRNTVSETITHRVYPVAHEAKRALLAHLIAEANLGQVLVFVATKFGASRLARYLEVKGILADAIHGDKSQAQRTDALEAFKSGKIRVLVGTDVAARGLDIDNLPHVINYELPHTPEDYIHRIGRTGRAGNTGQAVSLVAPEERGYLAEIEKLLKMSIEQVEVKGFEPGSNFHDAPWPRERGRHHREQGAAGEGRDRPRREEENRERPRREEESRDRPRRDGEGGERKRRSEETSDRPRREADKPSRGDDGGRRYASASPVKKLPPLGFDPSKPYESVSPPKDVLEGDATLAPQHPPNRPKRPVAALLGGLGKKHD
ncbi:MAG: DEAD/DEAH box helicase [Rhodocyclaceae bacterium]|nr:DEAD/DEAH box helicase [Rhodocyclaceae bacterium]